MKSLSNYSNLITVKRWPRKKKKAFLKYFDLHNRYNDHILEYKLWYFKDTIVVHAIFNYGGIWKN